MQPYKLISLFCDRGHLNTLYLSNLKPNRFKYQVSHRGTNSAFIFIKYVTILAKISFLRKGHSNTFILPNTKQNMFTYHFLNQEAHSTFPFIKLTKLAKLTFSRQGTFQDFSFYQIQNKICSHITF